MSLAIGAQTQHYAHFHADADGHLYCRSRVAWKQHEACGGFVARLTLLELIIAASAALHLAKIVHARMDGQALS